MQDESVPLPPRLRIDPSTKKLAGADENELKKMCEVSIRRRKIRAQFKKDLSLRKLNPIRVLEDLANKRFFNGEDEEFDKSMKNMRIREFLQAVPAIGKKKCTQFLLAANIQKNPKFNWLATKGQVLGALIHALRVWYDQYSKYKVNYLGVKDLREEKK